jgi:hypothetical protein
MRNHTILVLTTVFAFSLGLSQASKASTIESFSDTFGMEPFFDGKKLDTFEQWQLICLRHSGISKTGKPECTLVNQEFSCDPASNHISVSSTTLSTGVGTLKTIGGWIADNTLSVNYKDGSDDILCRFTINKDHKVSDAKCTATEDGKEVIIKMPSEDIDLAKRCGGIKFHGAQK